MVEQPTWSRWESGQSRPPIWLREVLRRLTARNPCRAAPRGIKVVWWETERDQFRYRRAMKHMRLLLRVE